MRVSKDDHIGDLMVRDALRAPHHEVGLVASLVPGVSIVFDVTSDAGHAPEFVMPIDARYVFIASMDIDADKEAIFNEVYDTEHIPALLRVPGVRAAKRMTGEAFAVSIGGKANAVAHRGPVYSAIFEIDSPDVLTSPQWASAVETGRWPKEVRPYTRNRQHAVFKVR